MSPRGHLARCGAPALAAVLATVLALSGTARAGYENAGTTAANFLALGSGARTLGMAGAGLGLGDDAGGSAWNPAALGWVHGTEVALSHAGLEEHSLQDWGVVGGRFGRSETRWALSGLYQGEGTIAGTDDAGASTGSFSVSSMAFGAMLAQQLGSRATLGVTAKAVREDIATFSGSGVTFDAGVMVRAGSFGIGAAAQNVGGRMSFGGSRYPFPTNVGVGLGFSHPAAGVRVALDANLPSAYHGDLRAGAEWLFRGALALRAGYRHELGSPSDPLTGPSFGVGAGHRGMWLDYAYQIPGVGSGQHRMGLRFRPGAGALGGGPALPAARAPAGDFDRARDGSRLGPRGSGTP